MSKVRFAMLEKKVGFVHSNDQRSCPYPGEFTLAQSSSTSTEVVFFSLAEFGHCLRYDNAVLAMGMGFP